MRELHVKALPLHRGKREAMEKGGVKECAVPLQV